MQNTHNPFSEALRLLAAEDERQSKLHELLETIREQIRTGIEPGHRPDGLFKNIQDAVYAMRGRTRLMDDAAITHILDPAQGSAWPKEEIEPGRWVDVDPEVIARPWPPLKKALWDVLMAENLNDGHYIKAFHLIEKLWAAACSVPSTAAQSFWQPVSEDDLARVLYEAEYDADSYPWEKQSSAEQLTYKSQAEAALRTFSIRRKSMVPSTHSGSGE